MHAIEGKKPQNVQLLLDCGADVEKTNKHGNTFRAHLAMISKKKEKKLRDLAFLSLLPSITAVSGRRQNQTEIQELSD